MAIQSIAASLLVLLPCLPLGVPSMTGKVQSSIGRLIGAAFVLIGPARLFCQGGPADNSDGSIVLTVMVIVAVLGIAIVLYLNAQSRMREAEGDGQLLQRDHPGNSYATAPLQAKPADDSSIPVSHPPSSSESAVETQKTFSKSGQDVFGSIFTPGAPSLGPGAVGVNVAPVPNDVPSAPVAIASAIPPGPESQASAPKTAASGETASASAKSLFVSYRRQDSQHITGRIYDRLAARFSRDSIFKDVDSIPLGLDFREHLREQVGRCAVLVAVIGRNWNPASASGQPRMSDPRDHLRIEIESALERNIPVIPVLVDGIEMPSEDELPPSLAPLAYRNGISIRPDPDFHHDADRLVRGIEKLLG